MLLQNLSVHTHNQVLAWLLTRELWLILAPLPIGFTVFLVHLATIPIAGTDINPARSTPCHTIKYEYNGEARNMVVTQFEVADARRCFPCWDEPAFKAKFNITLEVPAELVALSNMPVVKETAGLLDVACWVAAL